MTARTKLSNSILLSLGGLRFQLESSLRILTSASLASDSNKEEEGELPVQKT